MPGLEDLRDALEHAQAQRTELGTAMVDGGQAHRPQDAVRHRRWAGDLEEMASGGVVVKREHGNVLLWLRRLIFAYKLQIDFRPQ
jgi:hypothetical protein